MSAIARLLLLVVCQISLVCASSAQAKPDKHNWMEICQTVQQIVLPTIQVPLKDNMPKGDVTVNLEIDSNGDVTAAQLLSSSTEYGTLIVDAVKKWEFGKGPLSNTIPKKAEVNFRFKAEPDNYAILDEQDKFVVIVPLTVLDPKVLIAAGATIHSLAAQRVPASFPPNTPRLNGRIFVLVETDENGKVLSAQPKGGSPAYQAVAKAAALKWKFREIQLNGIRMRLFGNLVFNWVVN